MCPIAINPAGKVIIDRQEITVPPHSTQHPCVQEIICHPRTSTTENRVIARIAIDQMVRHRHLPFFASTRQFIHFFMRRNEVIEHAQHITLASFIWRPMPLEITLASIHGRLVNRHDPLNVAPQLAQNFLNIIHEIFDVAPLFKAALSCKPLW